MKVNLNDIVAWLKAQFMEKGYMQTYGMDYFETFSLVVKHTLVRLSISYVSSFDQPFCQLKVENAFLHGDLLKKVYIKQPLGFTTQREYEKVY